MYYEVIYETGAHSIAQYDSDEEAISAITEQHNRAKNGMLGGPAGTTHPAERIVRVLKYHRHPVELNEAQLANADDMSAKLGEIVERITGRGLGKCAGAGCCCKGDEQPTSDYGAARE
jgi:hypothetical protein